MLSATFLQQPSFICCEGELIHLGYRFDPARACTALPVQGAASLSCSSLVGQPCAQAVTMVREFGGRFISICIAPAGELWGTEDEGRARR